MGHYRGVNRTEVFCYLLSLNFDGRAKAIHSEVCQLCDNGIEQALCPRAMSTKGYHFFIKMKYPVFSVLQWILVFFFTVSGKKSPVSFTEKLVGEKG